MTNARFIQPPKEIGAYRLQVGNCQYVNLPMCHKPFFIHRFFMKILLGVNWVGYGKK
jgi:hypothetical protein